MTFRVGQKVVCVDARPTNIFGLSVLESGRVYTVRWVGLWGYAARRPNQLCIRLEEIDRGEDPGAPHMIEIFDMPFRATRFRPVVEKKTDISVFTAMLNQKQREHSLCGND